MTVKKAGLKGRSAMGKLTLIFVGAVFVFYIIVYFKKPSLAVEGLKSGGVSLLKVIPLILAAFALGGLLQVLIPSGFFSRWLGPQKGFRGILLGSLLGGITPGPIYLAFPVASGLLKGGAGIGTVIAYILAWDMWPIRRLPLEVALVGWKLVLIKFTLALPLSILAGFLANLIFPRIIF
jgi:uncharacterized membrane protein YraQ (UPF0718 family)